MTCIICGRTADACHIKSKGSGGTTDAWNIMHLCRQHHVEQHKLGWDKMSKKYHVVLAELASKGWRFILDGQLPNQRLRLVRHLSESGHE